jgi:hypothetical protein
MKLFANFMPVNCKRAIVELKTVLELDDLVSYVLIQAEYSIYSLKLLFTSWLLLVKQPSHF